MLCKSPTARGNHSGLEWMAAGLGQGSEHSRKIVNGGIAVANEEHAWAGIASVCVRAIRQSRTTAQGKQKEAKKNQTPHIFDLIDTFFSLMLFIKSVTQVYSDETNKPCSSIAFTLHYKKNIGFTATALASLSWVRYNDPPDLVVERIQQGKNSHASLYLSL